MLFNKLISLSRTLPMSHRPKHSSLLIGFVVVATFVTACGDVSGPNGTLRPGAASLSGGIGRGGGGGTVTAAPGVLTGPLYLRESFGLWPNGVGTAASRFDAAGNPVPIAQTSINQLRVEAPSISSEVWMTPDVHQTPSWSFCVGSYDPAEPFSTYDSNGAWAQGMLYSNLDNPSLTTNNDALLPFAQPTGALTASVSAVSGMYTTSVGFTPSNALTGNFENSGAAWLVLRMPLGLGSTATWELHTNGTKGATVSGTTVLGNFNRIRVSYDPATGTVVGSVNGVVTPALPYVMTGVKYVGIQGNGVVNDFRVEAGVLP
jgi:hypothetical protein